MNKRELRQYEMLVRVRDFGNVHGPRFPESSLAAAGFTTVTTAVKELTGFAVAQMEATRRTATARAAARAALLEALEAVSKTARVIEERQPDFNNRFRMPLRRNAQALLTAGRLFAGALAPVAASFIAHAMPETFISDLTTLVDRFDTALRTRLAGKSDSAAARARIETSFAAGFAAVRQLDVMVTNHLHDDPAATAAWLQDRTVQYPKYRTGGTADVDPAGAEPVVSAPAPPVVTTPAAPDAATPVPPTVTTLVVPTPSMPPVVEEEEVNASPPVEVSVFERAAATGAFGRKVS